MNRATVVFIIVIASAVRAISKDRAGAVCGDGTLSGASGHGTCSHHSGVKHWIYK